MHCVECDSLNQRVMKTAIVTSLIFFALSVHGEDEVCTITDEKFNVCKKGDTIVRVTPNNIDSSISTHFHLKIENDTAIGPKALSNLNITSMDINLHTGNVYDRTPPRTLSLQSDSFAELYNLTSLLIQNTKINFTRNSLSPLGSLVSLKLLSCGITDVPTDILEPLVNLVELHLRFNHLHVIHSNAFRSMKHLQCLDLTGNRITHLELGCFSGLAELRTLDLTWNYFKTVSIPNALDNLTNLNLTHALDDNGFNTQVLQDVPALTELRLGYNQLISLQTNVFHNIAQLRILSLDGNFLMDIPKGVFEGLESLRQLNLKNNLIRTIEPGAFAGLNLTTLDFSINDISKINSGTFNGLIVKILILQKNGIEELEPQAFNGLTANEMDLTRNALEKIGVGAFSGLNIGKLDLSRNRIEEISPGAFNKTKIKELDLSENSVVDKVSWGLLPSGEFRFIVEEESN